MQPINTPDRIMLQKSYKTALTAILTDPTTSAWLRARIQEMEKRDPVDAATDAAVLSKLAELRMTNAFGIQYATCVRLDDAPGIEDRRQAPFTLVEQERTAA